MKASSRMHIALTFLCMSSLCLAGLFGCDNTETVIPVTGGTVYNITETFVPVAGGTFLLGSPSGEPGRGPDETQHSVTLTRDFEIMTIEVTQNQFQEHMQYTPSTFPILGFAPERPVETVSWYDALAYANRFSEIEEVEPCYTLTHIQCGDGTQGDADAYCRMQGGITGAQVTLNGVSSVYACEGFRLPTESEWEYAARAGATSAFYNGPITRTACAPADPVLDAAAWYCANAGKTTHVVAEKAANSLGLYDVLGNVREWCWDGYQGAYPGEVTDPEGPADSHFHVVRGGGVCYDGAGSCRLAHRAAHSPDYQNRYVGFRLVRTLIPGSAVPASALMSPAAQAAPAAENGVTDYPDALPFDFTRPDVGEPLTPEEITAFTQKITAFWNEVDYFHWILWHSHGMEASNPDGMPDYKLYWQDTQAIKNGDTVTFEHRGGADNLMIRTSKLFNNASAGYLASGDPTMGRIVEQYSKGMVALFRGMMWDAEDPEKYIMARAIFTQDHTYTEDGRDAQVVYGPAKRPAVNWNAHTIQNPGNPFWGDIWVRNMRSKDDVPHIYRMVPMLQRVVRDGADPLVRQAASVALEHLQGFARDIVDSGYYIRTKDLAGNAYVPLTENGVVNDLASFNEYTFIVPEAECDHKLSSALIAYADPMGVECGPGYGSIYEDVATYQHYFNLAIVRYFHIAAATTALMAWQTDVAYDLLEGLADRSDEMFDGNPIQNDHRDFPSDVAAYLLASATAGLPLTSREARHIMEQYSLAVDHYETWPNWDLWAPAVPDGEVEYKPGRNGEVDGEAVTVVRPSELTYLLEYCYSPFRNEAGAPLVDCEVVLDPALWGTN